MKPESNHDLQGVVLRIGRAIILAEHEHFVAASVDNLEHVPRVLRLAQAVSTAVGAEGAPVDQMNLVREELEEYGRDLFMAEWNVREYNRLRASARRQRRDV